MLQLFPVFLLLFTSCSHHSNVSFLATLLTKIWSDHRLIRCVHSRKTSMNPKDPWFGRWISFQLRGILGVDVSNYLLNTVVCSCPCTWFVACRSQVFFESKLPGAWPTGSTTIPYQAGKGWGSSSWAMFGHLIDILKSHTMLVLVPHDTTFKIDFSPVSLWCEMIRVPSVFAFGFWLHRVLTSFEYFWFIFCGRDGWWMDEILHHFEQLKNRM